MLLKLHSLYDRNEAADAAYAWDMDYCQAWW